MKKSIVNLPRMFCFTSLGTLYVSKLIKTLVCPASKKSLLPQPKQLPANGHDYTSTIYHETGKPSSFTTFVNKGDLQIPSTSVFRTVEYCEYVFKATVTGKDGKQISNEGNLNKKDRECLPTFHIGLNI
jgi:hypothetical protein